MSDKNQRLVLAIIDFLNTSIEDGTVKADDKEGLEVAGMPCAFPALNFCCRSLKCSHLPPVQCIGEAFGVDPNDAGQHERLTIRPATLQSLFDVYLKTTAKMKSGAAAQQPGTSTSSAALAASSSTPKSAAVPTAEDKKAAESLKSQGNSYMSAKKYDQAIEAYTKATKLDPTNPVYFSNRAAAYSSIDDHDSAIEDAKKAAELDPTFVKAYSRLGYVDF
jgi:small glutamine-rich tetratricopeptide repeat-containing protein alpha